MNENLELKEYIGNDKKKQTIYNLLYTNLGEDLSNWNSLKSENTYEFYDILFDILHISYIYNLKNNAHKHNKVKLSGFLIVTFLPKNFIYFFNQYDPKKQGSILRSPTMYNLQAYDEFDIEESELHQPRRITYTEEGDVSTVSFSTDTDTDTDTDSNRSLTPRSRLSSASDLSTPSLNTETDIDTEENSRRLSSDTDSYYGTPDSESSQISNFFEVAISRFSSPLDLFI